MWKNPALDFVNLLSSKTKIIALCESPIEIEFACFLVEQVGTEFVIVPQYPIGGFRFDFALCDEKARPYIFIECDGKGYHSTPDQLANDREKTEFAESKGIPLLRLKGAEIYKAPTVVADVSIALARAVRGQRK